MLLVPLLQLLGLELILFVAASPNALNLPPGLHPPTGKKFYAFRGVGTQNYRCAKKSTTAGAGLSWELLGVAANLYDLSSETYATGSKDGKVVGNHFLLHEKDNRITPVWEFYGKRVFGVKVAAVFKDPKEKAKDIPWLELNASGGSGIKKVYRTDTKGGLVPPTKVCSHEGQFTKIAYTATYSFYE